MAASDLLRTVASIGRFPRGGKMTAITTRTIGAAATLAVAVAVATGGPAAAANAGHGVPAPKASHFGHGSNLITNPWFPLARGSVYVYEGQKDGKQARDVMTVTRRT